MQASWTGTIYITFLLGTTQATGWERTGPLSSPHPFYILIFDPVWKKNKKSHFLQRGNPFPVGKGSLRSFPFPGSIEYHHLQPQSTARSLMKT